MISDRLCTELSRLMLLKGEKEGIVPSLVYAAGARASQKATEPLSVLINLEAWWYSAFDLRCHLEDSKTDPVGRKAHITLIFGLYLSVHVETCSYDMLCPEIIEDTLLLILAGRSSDQSYRFSYCLNTR
jgi:hypothetical protein